MTRATPQQGRTVEEEGAIEQAVEVRSGEGETRREPAKKRASYGMNEYFDPVSTLYRAARVEFQRSGKVEGSP